MAFYESPRFPEKVSRGASGGPAFRTVIVVTDGGHEQRDIKWTDPLRRYQFAHALKTKAQHEELLAIWLIAKGPGHGFRVKDWGDFEAASQAIGTGNGATTTFQLKKTYSNAAGSYVRTIKKPVSGTVKVYLNAVEQMSGWSVNTTTGVVTFDVAPANGVAVTATCEFDVPCRFEGDLAATSMATEISGQVYDWSNISLVEIRV